MDPNSESIRRRLEALAAEAGPLRVRSDVIVAAVRRRRRAVTGAAGVAAAAAVGLTVTVVASVIGSNGNEGAPGAQTPSGTSDKPILRHPLSCGESLKPPLATTGDHGMALSITSVDQTAASGPPEVGVRLGVTEPVRVWQPSLTPLQILLVRDDVIVDRFGSPGGSPGGSSASGQGAIGRVWDLAPATPHSETVRGTGECADVHWAQVWADPARYWLVAVMSVPHAVAAPPGPAVTDDPLLTVRVPLAEV